MIAIQIALAIFGSIFLLLIPGFVWSYVFLRHDKINLLERVMISFGLSIALVTLSIFALNKLVGMSIDIRSSATVIAFLIAVPILIIALRQKDIIWKKITGLKIIFTKIKRSHQ